MIGIKVVMADPSKLTLGDPFGIVGAQMKLSNFKIEFKLAKIFQNTPKFPKRYKLADVAKYLQDVRHQVHPNFMGLETNNMGGDILRVFRKKYKMDYLHGVNTSGS